MTGSVKIQKFLIVCLCSLALVSCENRDNESDKGVSAEASALISLIKNDLDKTKSELTDLKHELQGVMEVQNEIVDQIKQLMAVDQEKAPATTEVTGSDVKSLVAQLNEQRQSLSRLESRFTQLGSMVENLRTSVTEQQSAINDLLSIVEEQGVNEEQEDIDY
jgi:chromosome segregation ATPase